MPLKKEIFEFVELEDHAEIQSDLERLSSSLQNAMDEVHAQLDLHQEKHSAISDAKEISKNILADIKVANEDLLRAVFKDAIGHEKIKMPLPEIELKAEKMEPEQLGADSRDAINNLQKNLAELRKELGIE